MHSPTTTPTIARLPTELLSKIIKNVQGIATLNNVSFTCRHFRNLALPLIFRGYVLVCRDDETDLSRHSARLDFYSSDAIARFVRGFMIRMPGGDALRPEHSTLVAQIFDALPRFINIRLMSCTGVNFTHFAVQQVSTLSFLEIITATGCSVPPKTDSLPMLRPDTFACLGVASPVIHQWLPLLDPDRLKILRVPLTEDLCSFFVNDNRSRSPFPALDAVQFYAGHEGLPMLSMLLSKIPSLRSFKLIPYGPDAELYIRVMEELVPPTVCPLPYLEEFTGPHKLLPIVLGQEMGSPPASLRRVLLESINEPGDPLAFFMNSFQSCHPLQLKAVTHIHISLVPSMDLKSLAKLGDMFPVLQVFNLHASERSSNSVVHDVDLTELYTLPLPCTLVSLSIQWISDQDAGVVNDLIAVRDNLVPRLPDLQRLWLYDVSKLALLWTCTPSRSEESCILHKVETDDMWEINQLACPEDSFFQL